MQILETIFYYQGFWGCEAKFHLYAYEQPDQSIVVLATEFNDNYGTSITNMAESLATQLRELLEGSDKRFIWIEHYPERGIGPLRLEESFSEVTFSEIGRKFVHPQWKYLAPEEVERLIGEPLGEIPHEEDPGGEIDRPGNKR